MDNNFLLKISKNALFTVFGTFLFIGVLFFIIVSIPVFVYRWILTKFIAPCFRSRVGKAVTISGHYMATEFIPTKSASGLQYPSPRCAIALAMCFPGTISLEELTEAIKNDLLNKNDNETELRYPEFKQYIEQWMGYMFWKPDPFFNLADHLHVHKLPDNVTDTEAEAVLHAMIEDLLNKRFTLRKSPWEMYLLQNYKNSSIQSPTEDGGVKTVILFRVHHAMADGLSILNAILKDMFGNSLKNIKTAQPRVVDIHTKSYLKPLKLVYQNLVYKPWRTIRDLGYCIASVYNGRHSPWNCPERKRTGTHIYDKSKPISVHKMKFIKNRFGVSFTAVLLSCLEAAIADNFRKSGGICKRFPILSILPLPGHPKKLRNHAIATIFELEAVCQDAVERLKRIHTAFSKSLSSQVHIIGPTLPRLISSWPAPMAKYVLKLLGLSAFFSNFSGHELEIQFNGRNMLSWDLCLGGLNGLGGVAFTVISYEDELRVAISAENGVMDRTQIADILEGMYRQVELLHEKASTLIVYDQEFDFQNKKDV